MQDHLQWPDRLYQIGICAVTTKKWAGQTDGFVPLFASVRNMSNYSLFRDSLYKESERCSYCKVESRISSSFMRLFVLLGNGDFMKPEEANVYREIQKNTEMAIKAIDALSDKAYEDDFALQISRQSLKYSDIRGKAMDKLLAAKAEPVHQNYLSDMMLKGAVQMNTLFNTSTSHLAELMIQGSNRGITEMCKILNHNPQGDTSAVELAKELMDFEEKNIAILKKYL